MASIHVQDTPAGRRYIVRHREGTRQRGRTFHRKKDAERFQADLIRRRQLGELYEDDAGTLGAFLDGWRGRYALRVRPTTAARRDAAFRALHELRAHPLAHISPAEVEDAVTTIALRAPRQAELALASLKLALKDAAKRGLRFDRRILELASPKAVARTPRFLTWQEVQQVAEWLPDRHARLVMVAALTGLRRGEMMALKWGDIDLEAGTLRVRAGKTEAARRVVDLPPTAVELLREQAAALTGGELSVAGVDGPASPPVSAPVFPNNRGGHMNGPNWYRRWWLPAVRATGHEGVRFHELRHSYASMLAHANVNPKVAAALLGHADGGALFLRLYSHLYPGAGRQAAEALEGIL